ncbi:MAG: YfhO family protein, partial [Lachnospiraceae bacterium]|nr:YfhO family protein [Lachnospiraceae bacterium]
IWPEDALLEFLTLITYLKICTASASMCRYLIFRDQRLKRIYAVLFSLCYGFSGYVAAFDWNVMWMWGIALAPLAVMYLECLIKEIDTKKSVLKYILVMAFITWTNYYIAMITDIFFMVYFLVVAVESFRGIKALLLSLFRFAAASVTAAAVTAVLLIPELQIIKGTSFAGNSLPEELKFYMTPAELMLRSLAAVDVETGLGHEPGTYASLALLIFLPLFFFNKEILLRHKLARGGLIIFFYLSFNLNILEFIWHGFNYPDSIPARQAFLLIITLLTIAYESLEGIAYMKKPYLAAGGLFPAAILIICLLFCREEEHADIYTFVISGIFTALYFIFLLLYIFAEREFAKWGFYSAAFTLVFELLLNFSLTSQRDIKRDSYFRHMESYRELAAEAEKLEPLNQGLFTRLDIVDENIRNMSSMAGFYDASYFSSTIEGGVEDFYRKFGMKASKVHYMAEGITPFTQALLGVHYLLADDFRNNETDYDIAFYKGEAEEDYLYECLFKLPFGYTVPKGYYGFGEDDDSIADPLDRQNKVSMKLGGDEVFLTVEDEYKSESDGRCEISIPEDGHYYAYAEAEAETITEYVSFSDGVYGEFEDMDYESVMDLGRLEKGSEVVLEADEDHSDKKPGIRLYRFDPVNMQELEDRLSESSLTLTGFEEDHIEGIVDMQEGRELVLCVPLSSGWSVVLDGKDRLEPESFYGLFMKLDIPEGVHHLSLDYHIPGLGAGLLVSL